MLSQRAKELIPKARIFTTTTIKDKYPSSVVDTFQQADDNGQYLSDDDIENIRKHQPQLSDNLDRAIVLRDNATQIVEQARKDVLAQFPGINEPGGGLYPPVRAEACWRDFWHFLRCISYGVAGEITNFTSQEGLKNMELLYQELQVPLSAMVVGLKNLRKYSLDQYSSSDERSAISPYFDHLIRQMKQFV